MFLVWMNTSINCYGEHDIFNVIYFLIYICLLIKNKLHKIMKCNNIIFCFELPSFYYISKIGNIEFNYNYNMWLSGLETYTCENDLEN